MAGQGLDLRSDCQSRLFAKGHAALELDDALVPALDDTAGADGNIEIAPSHGRVEPEMASAKLSHEPNYALVSLAVGLGGIREPTSVFHRHLVSCFGLVGAVALLDNLLCDAHCRVRSS